MKPPKAPTKPTKPTPPEETVDDSITINLDDYCYDNKSLGAILEEQFPGVSLSDIAVSDGYSRCGDRYQTVLKLSRLAPNPKYDGQMTKYHKKLEEYTGAQAKYKQEVEEYKKALALWHKEELEKLDGSI